jgi:ribosomal protein L30E
MSCDSLSDSSSVTSSVCEEFEQLIDNCHVIHSYIQTSIDTLDNIEYLIATQNNIQVTHNGTMCDLDEVLESIHLVALKNIKETGSSNFSKLLLDIFE